MLSGAGLSAERRSLEVSSLRLDTIGCSDPGVGNRIHFNAAGASLMPRPVVQTVTNHIREEALVGG